MKESYVRPAVRSEKLEPETLGWGSSSDQGGPGWDWGGGHHRRHRWWWCWWGS